MAKARNTLSGAKHSRKRPLQRCRDTCLGRDSNERPNRPLRVRWWFCHSCPISRRNPIPSCAALYAMGTDAIFMDDDARPHRARLVRCYLESETIPHMAWPARSPDLNPIEHVWDMLGKRIADLSSVPPNTLHELQQTLLQEEHYCHNKRSATLLPACLAFVKLAFEIEDISVWFPLNILPANLGCLAEKRKTRINYNK
ncbi:hypothetical protein AVEN_106325-1 [Araneus ventricosus]|uniref:Tc1-like transposase DDE domain-containing protein n=1 Tax=Araneus ventricosus TaxID=182803 RepID=A0A4Y2ASJ9_ARAVE|nr:hypothetical protein AVEN_106325-1 [Araneus ventricosus]